MPEIDAIEMDVVAKATLKDGVVNSLRSAILDAKLKPGQRMTESRMASKLGVSRVPVREALAVLQQEGLVDRDQSGLVVTRLSRGDVDEIGSLRLALESLAVGEVVRSATEADFAAMDENIRRTEKAIKTGEGGRRDVEFHELLVRAAHHSRLLRSWLSLRSQILLLLVQMELGAEEYAHSTAGCHKQLLAALRSRDETKALSLLRWQLGNTHQEVSRRFNNTDDFDNTDDGAT